MLSLLPVSLFFGATSDGGTDFILNQAAVPQDVRAPIDITDFGAVAQNVYEAILNRQWALVASLGVILLVLALRKWVPEKTAVGGFISSKFGGIVTNFVLSIGGALTTSFAAGQPVSAALFLKAVSVGIFAAGGWAIFKNGSEALDEYKAQRAGEVAARSPEDTLNK